MCMCVRCHTIQDSEISFGGPLEVVCIEDGVGSSKQTYSQDLNPKKFHYVFKILFKHHADNIRISFDGTYSTPIYLVKVQHLSNKASLVCLFVTKKLFGLVL